MSDARRRLLEWTDLLLDPAAQPGRQREVAQAWCHWALTALGVDENSSGGFDSATILPTGKAISPLAAARCVREYKRTAVFLQAMAAAIHTARQQFPGETIHVLEAGCGPLAPLALPFALRYPPNEVCFTLLDLHPLALAGARRLAGLLGVEASIRDYLAADATQVTFAAAERPHIVACEVLLRALTREPQLAATLNLAPQLRPRGLFLPEAIAVHAGLFDSGRFIRLLRGEEKTGSAVHELGEVFRLEAGRLDLLQPLDTEARRFAAAAVHVPQEAARKPLHLFTRIQVFREHRLGDFDSSLNLPARVGLPAPRTETGGRLEFFYESSSDPGLRWQ